MTLIWSYKMQAHRRGAEIAEEDFSSTPNRETAIGVETLSLQGLRSIRLMALVPIMSLALRNRRLFIWRYLSAK